MTKESSTKVENMEWRAARPRHWTPFDHVPNQRQRRTNVLCPGERVMKRKKIGGAEEDRTPDLRIAKALKRLPKRGCEARLPHITLLLHC